MVWMVLISLSRRSLLCKHSARGIRTPVSCTHMFWRRGRFSPRRRFEPPDKKRKCRKNREIKIESYHLRGISPNAKPQYFSQKPLIPPVRRNTFSKFFWNIRNADSTPSKKQRVLFWIIRNCDSWQTQPVLSLPSSAYITKILSLAFFFTRQHTSKRMATTQTSNGLTKA